MEKFLISLGIAVLVAAAIFLGAILGAAGGGFGGWLVGFIFPATCAKLAAITGFKAYQLGAIVGFSGGFMRTSVSNKDSKS